MEELEAVGGSETGGSGFDEGDRVAAAADAGGGFDGDLTFGNLFELSDMLDLYAAVPTGAGLETLDAGVDGNGTD